MVSLTTHRSVTMNNKQKLEYFNAVYRIGKKLAEDATSPEVVLAERAANKTMADQMKAAIPQWIPDGGTAEPGANRITLEDLQQCLERAGWDSYYAAREVFKLPQIQLAVTNWGGYARAYVDTVHDKIQDVVLPNLDVYLPPNEEVRASVKSEILQLLEALKAKTHPIVAQFVAYHRRPYTLWTEDLELLATQFEATYASVLADAQERQAFRLMAEVHAYLHLMHSRAYDNIVRAVWYELWLWDGFEKQIQPRLVDNMEEILRSILAD
ncbi:uncharacterized protein TRAVEDRAFT_47051 [Trametes versicolor FP-101664 SS1]|uniref:uncharacterized protein n=1 Tax=Trametes versicolor (strain FP-101664) TaxID=717944 RepID=UPI00046243AE|nr:uncharacterized protein TRAVEDRAFT_47051 [Trametes versicolor FP-101664 SS1]EIW59754.1 hypothetical protein TRAVEDRAFT_47051 [Trametes versicolor FP-101664 SS1]